MDLEAPTLFNLDNREITPDWVDPKQPLKIPHNPLHFKAHKLQLLVEMLSNQAKNNPAQFNSKNFIDALNEYTACIKAIKNGEDANGTDENLGSSTMATSRDTSTAEIMGDSISLGLDSGISAENPFAG